MDTIKTTGHIHFGVYGLMLALLLAFTSFARAGEVQLTTSNDLISGNQREDDLYTSGLAFSFRVADRPVEIGERMFTDREVGTRFDETYLEIGLEIPDFAGWETELEIGLLRTGRGIIGESLQNQIHRWVGSNEVDLEYVHDDHYYPTAAVELRRLIFLAGPLALHTTLDAFAAPSFRSWVRARATAELDLGWGIALRAGAGANLHQVSYGPLEPNINDIGASWELGVAYRKLDLRWTYNEMGTRSRHISLSYRLRLADQRSSGLVPL